MASRSDRASTWAFTLTAVLLALLAVWLIGWESSIYGEDVAASRNQGVLGTFTVTNLDCGKSCDATGDFASEDGRLAIKGIGLQQVDARHVGTRYRVQFFAHPHPLAYPLNPSSPIWGLLFAIGAAAYLAALGLSLILRRGRRFWAVVWGR